MKWSCNLFTYCTATHYLISIFIKQITYWWNISICWMKEIVSVASHSCSANAKSNRHIDAYNTQWSSCLHIEMHFSAGLNSIQVHTQSKRSTLAGAFKTAMKQKQCNAFFSDCSKYAPQRYQKIITINYHSVAAHSRIFNPKSNTNKPW